MKKKVKIDLGLEIVLLLISFLILLFPSFKITNVKLALSIIYGSYALLKLIGFILSRKEKDYEGLFTSVISLTTLIATIILKSTTKNIVLVLMIWIAFMSLVKLKKSDFYHDKNNKLWTLRIFILIVFIISGVLTGMNLAYVSDVQILIIGYFFLINNLLDTIDPITNHLKEAKK